MNWDAVAGIAEAVGAAGVIASLLYLASQVRAGTRASAVEAKLQSTRLLAELMDMLIQEPELNDLYLRGRADLESLSGPEYFRFTNMALKAFWFFSAMHYQFRMGTLSESDWHEVKTPLHYWLRGSGVRAWWVKLGSGSFGREFRDFVEAEIAALDTE